LFHSCFRSLECHRTTIAGPGRLSVRYRRRIAPDWWNETVAQSPSGPDRLRQDDGRRRDGYAFRMRAASGTRPDAAAERQLRGRGRICQPPGTAPHVPANVRAAVVPRPPRRSADRRQLATVAGRWFPRPRRVHRPEDVHQDHGYGRLIDHDTTTTVTVTASPPPCHLGIILWWPMSAVHTRSSMSHSYRLTKTITAILF